MANNDRVLVLVSGGIDSSALCAQLSQENKEVYGLFIDRGQSALENEKAAVCRIKSRIGIRKIFNASFDISEWRQMVTREEKESMGIPGRNMIMVSLAIPYAFQKDCYQICIGSLPREFSDSSEHFLCSLDQAVKRLTYDRIIVRAPFIEKGWSKPSIIQWVSKNMGSDFFDLCYSCYRRCHKGYHCGTCGGCKNRKQSFDAAGIRDTTSYCLSSVSL